MARPGFKRRHTELQLESVTRISNLPIIESGIGIAGNVYERIKVSPPSPYPSMSITPVLRPTGPLIIASFLPKLSAQYKRGKLLRGFGRSNLFFGSFFGSLHATTVSPFNLGSFYYNFCNANKLKCTL
jgi:hypothetical protein